MELLDINTQSKNSKKDKKRFAKLPETYVHNNKSNTRSIDLNIIKVYKISPKKPRRSKRKNSLIRKNKSPVYKSINNYSKLPDINTPKYSNNLKINLQGREDKLNDLINKFIDEKPNISTLSSRRIYENPLDFQNEIHAENKFYEKNLQKYPGEDLTHYVNDTEKNLKIEKIRSKNYKRYRLRLLSAT
jgi:hypothetical protein